jgi:rRNA-processing protein EBP2
VAWPAGAAWAEGRALTSARADEVASVDDDLARETAFYHQAAAAVTAALASYEAAGVPWARPTDFYAEMVKSDDHMARVKAQLDHDRTSADAADERRKARSSKQYAKEVAAERRKEKTAAKKAAVAGVAKLRADRKRSGYAGHLDADAALRALESGAGVQALGGRTGRAGAPTPSRKRAAKDAKYGFGGRKAGKRNNDAYSAADVSDWRKPARGGDAGLKRKGGGGGVKRGNR